MVNTYNINSWKVMAKIKNENEKLKFRGKHELTSQGKNSGHFCAFEIMFCLFDTHSIYVFKMILKVYLKHHGFLKVIFEILLRDN